MNLIPSLIYTAIPNPSPERTQQWSITYKVTCVQSKWSGLIGGWMKLNYDESLLSFKGFSKQCNSEPYSQSYWQSKFSLTLLISILKSLINPIKLTSNHKYTKTSTEFYYYSINITLWTFFHLHQKGHCRSVDKIYSLTVHSWHSRNLIINDWFHDTIKLSYIWQNSYDKK